MKELRLGVAMGCVVDGTDEGSTVGFVDGALDGEKLGSADG